MPQIKNVESLVKLCLKCIQVNIENNNSAAASLREATTDQTCKFVNSEQLDSVSTVGSKTTCSPFHDLPTDLLEDIIKSLSGWDRSNPNDWQKITPLENIVLSHLFTSRLKNLWLNSYKENYLNYFQNFGKLQVLDISKNVSIGDNCFKLIGTYCKCLRVLDACGCINVTDSGVQWLCVGFNNLGEEKGGQCKLIEKLVLYVTKVTKKGIEMALTHLPALRILDHETTVEVLIDIAVCHKPFSLRFSLTKLWIFAETIYCRNSLWIAVSVCPMLTNIKICINNSTGFTDSDFFCLKYIKKLRELAIFKVSDSKFSYSPVTFRHSLAPLLKVSGNLLEKLHLWCFDTVDDVWTIIECCPNLRSLNLSKNADYQINPIEDETYHVSRTDYRKKEDLILKELIYLNCHSFNFPTDILSVLLSSPALVYVQISNCDWLTDNVLQDAAKLHKFHNLEIFEISDCCTISYKGIDALMEDGNSLFQIGVDDCKEITLDNVLGWKKRADKKNWQLWLRYWYLDNNSQSQYYSSADDDGLC